LFYQVGQSVNAKHKDDGKFYGAFISCVNVDGTYKVYFTEDSIQVDNVEHKDIKLPIATKRQQSFGNWEKYIGKLFYDPGTKENTKKKITEFQPGEFVVLCVVCDNNFLCGRVGSEKEEYPFDIGYVLKRIRKYEEE